MELLVSSNPITIAFASLLAFPLSVERGHPTGHNQHLTAAPHPTHRRRSSPHASTQLPATSTPLAAASTQLSTPRAACGLPPRRHSPPLPRRYLRAFAVGA
ncbi:unnamed protein product [Linum trigynum]|uniref:Uncharacterized protein n=1 Tax=Linum trigynum TaxID=586398 RepID=A0AAV2ERZ7_9ROSI